MHPEKAQKADTEKTRLSGPVSKSRSITRKIQRLSRQRLSRRATIIPQSSPADQHIKMFFRFASIEHKKINLAPGGGRPSARRGMCARRVCVKGSGCWPWWKNAEENSEEKIERGLGHYLSRGGRGGGGRVLSAVLPMNGTSLSGRDVSERFFLCRVKMSVKYCDAERVIVKF